MKRKYFDKEEYESIIRVGHSNIILANSMLASYHEKYPSDYTAALRYAGNLISLNNFEAAEEIIEDIKYVNDNNRCFIERKGKSYMKVFDSAYAFTRLRYYLYTHQYEEAYKLILDEPDNLLDATGGTTTIKLFVEKKLGYINYKRDDFNVYEHRQVVDYSYNEFRKYIERFLSTEYTTGCFVPDFPVDEMIRELKKLVPNDNKLNKGIIDNHYYFKYDNCGITKKGFTDYFSLVTYDDSNEFITLFPDIEREGYPYMDVNYMRGKDLPPYKRVRKIQ